MDGHGLLSESGGHSAAASEVRAASVVNAQHLAVGASGIKIRSSGPHEHGLSNRSDSTVCTWFIRKALVSICLSRCWLRSTFRRWRRSLPWSPGIRCNGIASTVATGIASRVATSRAACRTATCLATTRRTAPLSAATRKSAVRKQAQPRDGQGSHEHRLHHGGSSFPYGSAGHTVRQRRNQEKTSAPQSDRQYPVQKLSRTRPAVKRSSTVPVVSVRTCENELPANPKWSRRWSLFRLGLAG